MLHRIRKQMDPVLSNDSRGTLMSYTDHSVQRRLKSNGAAPVLPGLEFSSAGRGWV